MQGCFPARAVVPLGLHDPRRSTAEPMPLLVIFVAASGVTLKTRSPLNSPIQAP